MSTLVFVVVRYVEHEGFDGPDSVWTVQHKAKKRVEHLESVDTSGAEYQIHDMMLDDDSKLLRPDPYRLSTFSNEQLQTIIDWHDRIPGNNQNLEEYKAIKQELAQRKRDKIFK